MSWWALKCRRFLKAASAFATRDETSTWYDQATEVFQTAGYREPITKKDEHPISKQSAIVQTY